MPNGCRLGRDRILEELRRELLGPTKDDEEITEYPRARYLIGRLAPAPQDATDEDGKVDPSENDVLGAGGEGAGGAEDGTEEPSPPLIMSFEPSSCGLSFLVKPDVRGVSITVRWGEYKRTKAETTPAPAPGDAASPADTKRTEAAATQGNPSEAVEPAVTWRRRQRVVVLKDVPIDGEGKLRRVPLDGSNLPPGASHSGDKDPEVTIEGVVRAFGGYRAVSLFVVNRRKRAELKDRAKDERWLFQPSIRVEGPAGAAIFVSKDSADRSRQSDNDGDAANNGLIYRERREFATGHGVAVNWECRPGDRLTATAVFTEFIPTYEVPQLIAPADQVRGAVLDMATLASADTIRLVSGLRPLLDAYEQWAERLAAAAAAPDISSVRALADAAAVNIRGCRRTLERMRAGLTLLQTDPQVADAFRFANKVMWDQRINSIWASENRRRGKVDGAPNDRPEDRTWRPFQMGFILLNLRGIAEPTSADRKIVDLLWFPTGGGKTEAYLGLAAFALALRRLRAGKQSPGVSIIMRYTLRLLTVQQFQRAAALMCACEIERKRETKTWGDEPFTIGVWVGRKTTPNTFADSQRALKKLASRDKPSEGTPVQLVACPRCGEALVDKDGRPENKSYVADPTSQRTLVFCPREKCAFSYVQSGGAGVPVVVVDAEVYRVRPSFLVATVDKFAQMPFKGEVKALFGARDRLSPRYGHLTDVHDTIEGKAITDATPAGPLLPPDLIIQDELHLISGPLGTMVGLYETAVDYLTQRGPRSGRIPAKVIASTATIRRAAQQVRQLYARDLSTFPPPGIDAADSFFARERAIDPDDDGSAGRLYVGLNAPGSSSKTLLVRTYAILLAAAAKEIKADPAAGDPYGTLVGYFNSLRTLGGAKRLVEDDIALVRMKYLYRKRQFERPRLAEPQELTSRLDSWRIPGLLKKLDIKFPRQEKSEWPVDVLLATNMISVGVDIDRLGLMVVTGQPKSTSEYIQATSRVGRKYPGLVVTMYNWLGARDLSHYERFVSYHEALYRYVEAISVTPFSSRALDRALPGVLVSMHRLGADGMAANDGASQFPSVEAETNEMCASLERRAADLTGEGNAARVSERLRQLRDDWNGLAKDPLLYAWRALTLPPDNARVLLGMAGGTEKGFWPAPGSLREVEAPAAFYLDEG